MVNQPHSGRWRIICHEPCDVADSDANYPGMLWNLSVAGAYVEMQPPLVEAGQEVTLSFCLPGELTVIRVTAKVAWINPPGKRRRSAGDKATQLPPGFGLEFTNLAQIDRTRITARVQGM